MRSSIAAHLCPLAALLLLLTAAAAGAQPHLLFGNGEKAVARLPIGDHLLAGLAGAAPHASYQLVLTDDHGKPVAMAAGKTDAAGRLAPLLLWAHSGVVGCDRCAAPDSGKYLFRTFAEAASVLDGREFAVSAFDAGGAPVARRGLGLLASGTERPYFSDAASCPRFSFDPLEPVYLSFENPEAGKPPRHLYLIADAPEGVLLGQPLADVRDPGPPPVVDPAKPNLVWVPEKDDEGDFNGVVSGWTSYEAVFREGDRLMGPGGRKSLSGLSITVDTANCPPPPSP